MLNPNRLYDPYNNPYAQMQRDIDDANMMAAIFSDPYLGF